MTPLRGVNLGGWLILEKWMTPSLFDGTDAIDEYTFMSTSDAAAKLDRHRREFIQEADFAWIAAHGLNAVRIPIGYWIFEGDEPYLPAVDYLDWALAMAETYNLWVLIDLHGLPGSQNGNDHSGRVGDAAWARERSLRKRTLGYLDSIAARYGAHPKVWGIQIINEPNPAVLHLALRRYYSRAYRRLGKTLSSGMRIIYSDAWSPRLLGLTLLFRRHAVMDVHLYHMATLGSKTHSLDWFYQTIRRKAALLQWLSRIHPIIIGEWSGVISHETVGGLPSSEQDRLFSEYVALQKGLYKGYAGWFYWSYKTEKAEHWNYRAMVERGLIVSD